MDEKRKPGRPPHDISSNVETETLLSVSLPKVEVLNDIKHKGSKIIKKGDANFRHDLFELEPAECLKDVTPYAKRATIVRVEHKHYFHTFDTRRGKKLTSTEPKQGHIHEMTFIEHDDGSVSAECGPPLRERILTDGNGEESGAEWVPVSFLDKKTRSQQVDDHRHVVTYVGSETMSVNGNKARNSQTAKDIVSLLKE